MFTLDFSLALALFLFLFLTLAFFSWLCLRQGRGRGLALSPEHIWHCAVCAYSYINTRQEAISVCPRCGSYNKKSGK
jgi:hypothetical protein